MTNHRILIASMLILIDACRLPDTPAEATPRALPVASASTFLLVPTIALTSTRDDPTANPLIGAEIYLVDPDGSNPRRLTTNAWGDGFPSLSPDGKKLVFDSNRRRTEDEPLNTSDLFVMSTDGTEQTFLTRGSSASWSPDGKWIAYHASASGTGAPIKPDPGAATFDSDIFIANLDDLLAGTTTPRNLTQSASKIDDDPSWSPDGQRIVFTSHDVTDNQLNSVTAEIYVMNTDGTGLTRLTFNTEEERGPSWSPDGSRILFSCRRGGPDFELCLMNADGSGQVQLTNNTSGDLTATFSPDGQRILFHRTAPGQAQLFTIKPDGTDEAQLTFPPGLNLLASWGELRVHVARDP